MRITLLISFILIAQNILGQGSNENYLKARSLMLNQSYDSALYYFNLSEREIPGNIECIYNRGICYFEINNFEKAISDFLTVDKRRSGMASFMLAKSETRLNHPELAVKYLKEHMNSSYKKAEKDILLDEDFSRLESTSVWKSLWKEREWYNSYDKTLQEVCYLKSTGSFPEAINLLNDLDSKGYKRSIVNQYLAEIYLSSGNNKVALEALDKSIRSDSRNMESLKMRIDLYIIEKEYDKAKTDCDRLLKHSPDEFPYYLVSGEINNRLGNYDLALYPIHEYIKFYPNSAEAYNSLGKVHYDNGKYLYALSAFNKALDLNKGHAEYYFNRGLTYAATKTNKYAERDFSMALDLDPTNSQIWYSKGLVDMALGDNDVACFDFRKALHYGNYDAMKYINKLCDSTNGEK